MSDISRCSWLFKALLWLRSIVGRKAKNKVSLRASAASRFTRPVLSMATKKLLHRNYRSPFLWLRSPFFSRRSWPTSRSCIDLRSSSMEIKKSLRTMSGLSPCFHAKTYHGRSLFCRTQCSKADRTWVICSFEALARPHMPLVTQLNQLREPQLWNCTAQAHASTLNSQ